MKIITLGVFRNKIIIWLSLVSVIMLGCIIGIIIPTKNTLTSLKNQIITQNNQSAQQTEQLQNTIVTQKHATNINKALTQLQNSFVSTSNPLDFINRVETMAKTNNVILDLTVDNQAASNTNSSEMVVLNITITGELTNCLTFVNELLRDPTYINITNLTITPANSLDSNTAVIVNLKALSYWQ
ncbi:MAG: hypothetical protein WCW27_02875 [Patescibacteria group bacterium]|jgi:hypothetical protein